jgi:hypothetical protein
LRPERGRAGRRSFAISQRNGTVVIDEPMTRDAMHARIEIEAARRGIERVAWIEET